MIMLNVTERIIGNASQYPKQVRDEYLNETHFEYGELIIYTEIYKHLGLAFLSFFAIVDSP